MRRDTKSRSNRSDNKERAIVDLLKSSGYLFPETDSQMAAYEANVKLRELPEKVRMPEFVFKVRAKKNQ